MSNTALSAGDKIEARCSKCGGNTKHMILAISGQTPNRVKCDLCDREHVYRPPAKAKSGSRATTTRRNVTRSKGDPRTNEIQLWEKMHHDNGGAPPTLYAMDASYTPAMRITHPTFGIGLVVGLPGPQRVEVLFKEGKKVLRCA